MARTLAEVFPDERLFGGSTFRAAAGKREVRLREAELADMLDAMGERASFILERSDGGAAAPAPTPWTIAEDIPTASLEFLPSEGGYDLRLSKEVLVVRGLEVAFVLADGIAARTTGADARAFSFLRDAELDAGRAAFVAERDAEAFCRRALPCWRRRLRWICPRRGRRCARWLVRSPSTST